MSIYGRIPMWVTAILLACALVFTLVAWWSAASGLRIETVPAPGVAQSIASPAPPPSSGIQDASASVQVVPRESPVDLYITEDQPNTAILIVPRNQSPAQSSAPFHKILIPDQFHFQGRLWQPSGETTPNQNNSLQRTGLNAGGNVLYAESGLHPPYDDLYIETEPWSGVFADYTPID